MSKNSRSCFITIEGIEGAGKSTVMDFIKQYLQQRNIHLVVTREPGGTEIAEAIREVILAHYNEAMDPYTELLLYFASRAQHLSRVIKPALNAGRWVISDRFTDASFAYQGIGRNIPESQIAMLENLIQGELRPDLTIILDVDPETGLARAKKTHTLDRIESEKIEFFQRVRDYYLQRAQQFPQRYKVIDAMQSISEVEQQLSKILVTIG